MVSARPPISNSSKPPNQSFEGRYKRTNYNLCSIAFLVLCKGQNPCFFFLFEFYGISTFVDYFMPNPFLYK